MCGIRGVESGCGIRGVEGPPYILTPLTPSQIGVDDMDVFKGIELKLLALERLLDMHPEWRGKLVLVQVGEGEGKSPVG